MRTQFLVPGLAVLLLARTAVAAPPSPATPSADYALVNARIYTMQDWTPWAHGVAVAGDRIVYVGEPGSAGWKAAVGPRTRIYDLHGRLVLPGLTDAHTHPGEASLTSWHTILPWTMDPDEQLSYLRSWAATHPEPTLIYAEYYPTQMFGAAGPNKALIDKYLPDRPVIWEDFSDHSAALNSRALELMGIDRNTPDPEPGVSYFVRDADGNPNGWVKERAYTSRLEKLLAAIPHPPPDRVTPDDIARLLGSLSDMGVMALFDGGSSEDELAALAMLDRQARLPMYYEGSMVFEKLAELPAKITELRRWQHEHGTRHVRIRTLKLYLDGTNEIGTSALLEPFANDPSRTGEPRMSGQDLVRTMVLLNDEDLDLHIHMTGDRTFRHALDAVEAARRELGPRWRMQVTFTHCELIADEDFARVAPLGVYINWTPHWSGGYFQGQQQTLGMERYNNQYRFQPIISSGGRMTYGSDTTTLYEWARANPFLGMQIAHTRYDVNPAYQVYGYRKPASERLQLKDLVRGYTLTGAAQLRLDDRLGSIEAGKLANFVVLGQDLFAVPADEIHSVTPTAVVFEGKAIRGTLDAP